MGTLDLRLARQAANAAAVAELLAGSAGGHRRPLAVARRATRRSRSPPGRCCGPTGSSSAVLADEEAVATLLSRTRLWTAATSFGGVHSTIDRRAQWGGDAVEPGFVRLSCGIEDTDDLVADLVAPGLDGLACAAAAGADREVEAQPDVVDEVGQRERDHHRVRVGQLRERAPRR